MNYSKLLKKWQEYERSGHKRNKQLSDMEVKSLLQEVDYLDHELKNKIKGAKEAKQEERKRCKNIVDGIRSLNLNPNFESILNFNEKRKEVWKDMLKHCNRDEKEILENAEIVLFISMLQNLNKEFWEKMDLLFSFIKETVDGEGYSKTLGL